MQLSIGSEGALDADHLARLKHLVGWLKPTSFSEHLAWSTHDTGFLNDLLPVPYDQATLNKVVEHVDQVQEVVGRQMLLENPSTYVQFAQSTMEETEFLSEIAKRTGCGLLLDVNNVFVSATNQNYHPKAYLDAFPTEHVGEILMFQNGPCCAKRRLGPMQALTNCPSMADQTAFTSALLNLDWGHGRCFSSD